MSAEDLSGKVVVITGGSSGIGAAAARRFAQRNAIVVVGYNQGEARARDLVAGLPGTGHAIARLPLEEPAAFHAAAERLAGAFGRIDVLVNSAGFTRAIRHADLEALDDALFEQILIANVRGPYSAIRAFLPLLRASGAACVVNVSSISGFTASGSNVAYCAAKAALDNMSMSLARALGPEVRVLSVSPGAVATDFVPGRDRARLEADAQATPLKRVVEPEDVADAILACATLLRLSTGTRIVVDGGRHL